MRSTLQTVSGATKSFALPASRLCLLAILTAALPGLLPAATAGDITAEARAERPNLLKSFPEAFAIVADDPALPRVLLIGDSISIGYTPGVRELLRGVANVHRIPDNGGPTTRGLAMIEEWLGCGHWDVIHFNFGLHDIARVDNGEPRVSPADYDKNLRAIVERLHVSGARLVFATTTPVPSAEVRPRRRNEDAIAYNASATELMAEQRVAIDDLYASARARLAEIQQPANVHFTPAGYRMLAEAVAASIQAMLAKPLAIEPAR